jgi:signal transduction histidine kinase
MHLEGPKTELWIEGDERRIEQIVSNLVSNAIKYTPTGTVAVGFGSEENRLRVDVSDTGPGIAQEDQGHLFKRFSQLKPSQGGLVEGAGLGLAIAAGLAEAMGGEVLLRSNMGVGSVFSLVLPVAAAMERQ